MLNFEEWDKTNVVIVDETHSKEPLRIRTRKSPSLPYIHDMKISFETAFKYAKEFGWNFKADESLSSVKIYLELQKELNREVRSYWILAIKNWNTKEKLTCPENADAGLVKQYNIANAILGYEDSYNLLPDDIKSRIESNKRFVEGIVARNQ